MAEVLDKHFVDGSDDHFPKGLVDLVVLIEDSGGDVMGVLKVGDLGDRRDRWDGGLGAGVGRSDEGCGQECCVHGRGYGEF